MQSAPIYVQQLSDAEVGGGICRMTLQPGLQEIRGRIINTVSWRDEYVRM